MVYCKAATKNVGKSIVDYSRPSEWAANLALPIFNMTYRPYTVKLHLGASAF